MLQWQEGQMVWSRLGGRWRGFDPVQPWQTSRAHCNVVATALGSARHQVPGEAERRIFFREEIIPTTCLLAKGRLTVVSLPLTSLMSRAKQVVG